MSVTIAQNNIKLVSYIPHGAMPDVRGFAPSIAAYNLMKNLKRVSVFTISNQETYRNTYEIDSGIGPIFRIKEGILYRRLFRKITRLDPYPLHARAARIVRRIAPDILHAHQVEFPVADFLRRNQRKIPVVVHVHAIRAFDESLGLADRYIAVSEHTRKMLIERGYPAERIEVAYNGVDTDLFSPLSDNERLVAKKALNIAPDGTVVSFIGRKQRAKGFYSFLKVAKELLERHPKLFVLVAGPPLYETDPERDAIKQLLASFHGNRRFLDFPALPHDRLSGLYKITDIILLPTVFDGEQHPLVVIEAMATGCLTIATALAGIRETIKHGQNGLLLSDASNFEEIIETTESSVKNLTRLADVRKAARAYAVSTFDWKISAAKLEILYYKLCLSRNAG